MAYAQLFPIHCCLSPSTCQNDLPRFRVGDDENDVIFLSILTKQKGAHEQLFHEVSIVWYH